MDSAFPVADPLLWLRWLFGAAIALWLPGHALAGRWLRGVDPTSRIVIAVAVGLLLAPIVALILGLLGLPLTLRAYLAGVLVAAVGAALARPWRRQFGAWRARLPALRATDQVILLGLTLLAAGLVWAGFRDFTAPPHLDDASNHAFLVRWISRTASCDPAAVFAGEIGRPDVPYLMGWHAAAALIAAAGGVAPYVSAWFLPLALLCLMPASLTLLWRAGGLPRGVLLLGAALVVTDKYVPAGILGWGGFGQIAGMFLIPTLVVALAAALDSDAFAAGALLGLLLSGLLRIHASEILVALLLGWILLPAAGTAALPAAAAAGATPRGRVRRWPALVAAAGVFVLCALPDAARMFGPYAAKAAAEGSPLVPLSRAFAEILGAGGRAGGLKPMVALGVLVALFVPRLRRLALLSLGVDALYLALAAFGDPVSRWLATPFYRQAPRLLYLQAYLLGPVMACPFVLLASWARRRWGTGRAALAAGLLFAVSIQSAVPGVVRMYRSFRDTVPFGPAEYALARRIRDVVPPDSLIANAWDDGSVWAMEVSDRRFLLPCQWQLFDTAGHAGRALALCLLDRPWSPEALSLRDRGVSYAYASDVCLRRTAAPPFPRAAFDGDPRFVPVLREGAAALYRIRWNYR